MRPSTVLAAASIALLPALAAAQEDLTNPIGGQRPPTGVFEDPPRDPEPDERRKLTPQQILIECARQLASGAQTCTIPSG